MALPYPDLVLGTDHTIAFHSPQLRLFYDKLLIAIIQPGAQRRHDYLLSGRHIRRTANDLRRLFSTGIHRADMHVVGVRMRFAGQDLPHNQTFQSAFYRLHFLYATHFKSD